MMYYCTKCKTPVTEKNWGYHTNHNVITVKNDKKKTHDKKKTQVQMVSEHFSNIGKRMMQ